MASWKVTLPCTRAEAEAIDIAEAGLAEMESPPVLMTSERAAEDSEAWQLDAYFASKPNSAAVAAVKALVPDGAARRARVERIRDADWVTLSQAGIAPVHAGRFYVHTATNKGEVPHGARALRIDAGLAFGTGTHETTSGCLLALDALRTRGAVVRNLLDLGTGTGLLAFAAMHLWPRAHATASDIDPRSIEVTRGNAAANGVALGEGPGRLALAAAAGLDHPLLIARAPYDLIVANILAGPLVELAPGVSAALAEGGTLILAGLIERQAETVARAYRREGLRLAARAGQGDWPTLKLVKRVRYGRGRVARGGGGRGTAPGYGSW